MKRVWNVYGLIQVNTEPEGYSEIVYEGETRPVLKAPADISYGWKHLTAIYSDEFKEIYLGTLRRTLLYMGAKVYINCPCVFYNGVDNTIELTADLFYHNRRVPKGKGSFYHRDKMLNPNGISVVNGVAKYKYKIPKGIEIIHKDNFSFSFWANMDYQLAPASDDGLIYVWEVPKNKTPLKVEVFTTFANKNETSKLIARVYHKNYTNYVKYPTDIPTAGAGYVVFYLDGKRVETSNGKYKFDINSAGFASAPFVATQSKGTHSITVNFYPDTPELKTKYEKSGGCGTLIIGDDPDKANISLTSSNLCTFIGNNIRTLNFSSNKNLGGKVFLYMDMQPLHLLNSDGDDGYSLNVDGLRNFELSFDTMGQTSHNDYHWNFTGYHNLALKYVFEDGDYVPLEFWYYLDDFFIQRQTAIEIEGEEDNNIITYNGEQIYVGNNLYYLDGTTYRWHSPQSREKNVTIGENLVINVKDVENPERKVNEGFVKVTFVTRNNKTLEENLDGW